MSRPRKLLMSGGAALAALGMLYGLHYAVFIEHQTLDRIGGSLATAFVEAAQRNAGPAQAALGTYTATKYRYVRQVDVHSHWIGLAMLMIVLGVVFDNVGFSERVRFLLALGLLLGSIVFPLGVILQTAGNAAPVGSALAIGGAGLLTLALAAVAAGMARQQV